MVLVDDVVPNGMKFVGTVMVLEKEGITTLIALWKFLGISITAVKRLMNVSHIVDEKSESKRFTLFLGVHMLHNSLVGDGGLSITSSEPGKD